MTTFIVNRPILKKLSHLPAEERAKAMQEFFVLANLRKLETVVEEEASQMPSLQEVLQNEVLGREYKKGLQEGLQEGRQEGELAVIRRLIEKRFGLVPEWVAARLSKLSAAELEELGPRLLDTPSLEALFR